MKKNNNRKSTAKTVTLQNGVIVFAAILIVSTCLFLIEIWEKGRAEFTGPSETLDRTISYNGTDYVLKEDIETILMLGLDKFGNNDSGSYNNDKHADFLLVVVMDNAAETCRAIHINRDTMAEMNILGVAGDKIGTIVKQIALSHTYGNGREVSCRNTANAVSGLLLGMEIDHYVSVGMDAVSVYNDLVGGITLEIRDDFTSVDSSMIKGETLTLTGEQALYYVRSRYGLDDPTNNSRMERQRQYLDALFSQTRKLASEDESFVSRTALKMTDYIVSDCSGNKLENLMQKISEYGFKKILDIDGETLMGEEFLEFYPDETSVMEAVVECFYETKK